MADHFANIEDMNGQLRCWLDTVANVGVHGATYRVVGSALARAAVRGAGRAGRRPPRGG